jgi:hypothetical protein
MRSIISGLGYIFRDRSVFQVRQSERVISLESEEPAGMAKVQLAAFCTLQGRYSQRRAL